MCPPSGLSPGLSLCATSVRRPVRRGCRCSATGSFEPRCPLWSSQDFDVGKVYKKKVTLINATYTINYCKLEGVEEHLRDFISVE